MRAFFVVLLFIFTSAAVAVQAIEPERLFFLNNGEVLQAFIYKPSGKGPYPVVIYNQNAPRDWSKEKNPKPYPELATFYTSNGYALVVPSRRRWNETDQNDTSTNGVDSVEQQKAVVRANQSQAEVVFSAIETLKAQSYVDAHKIFITGHASGGTTTLFIAEKDVDVRGYVVFSPAASMWGQNPILQNAMKQAVRNAKVPIFFIQVENDRSLAPIKVLGKELEQKGAQNRVKTYPPYGADLREATLFSMTGSSVWGSDVLDFFKDVSK